MKRLGGYFLQGLVFLVPIVLSIWAISSAFVALDGWTRFRIGIGVPGAGLVTLVLAITLVGFLASNFFTSRVLAWLQGWLDRVPLVKLLHSSIRDLMNAFVGKERRFGQPVLVELSPASGVRAVGFLTRESLDSFGVQDHVAVYFPQAYNFAGQVLVVPRRSVTPVAAQPSEVMTFLVSGGVSGR